VQVALCRSLNSRKPEEGLLGNGLNGANQAKEAVKDATEVGGCRRRRKAFFRHLQALGIATDDTFRLGVRRKMVYAGSHASSFQQAA
jgi:hypothetical protein